MSDRDLFGETPAPPPNRAARLAGQFGGPKRPTRADHMSSQGMTPKKLAAQTRRSLNSARATIERLAIPWADIVGTVEMDKDTLLAAFDEFEQTLSQHVEWL